MQEIRNQYAFMHIEKAAGTTLIHQIRRSFLFQYADVRPVFKRQTPALKSVDLKAYRKILPNLRFIGGHSVVPHSDLEAVFPNLKYITIVREPITRLESHYTHWAQRKDYQGSFSEFINLSNMRNFLCNKISGTNDANAAIDILKEKFIVVGLFEDMATFYRKMHKAIPEFPEVTVLDHANKRHVPSRAPISDTLRDYISELNEDDLKVYDWIKSSAFCTPVQTFVRHGARNQSQPMSRYLDYGLRKFWLEPLSGAVRIANGLPYQGSYQRGGAL